MLDLPGCISQGKTLEEAKENVKDAIAGYLEVEKKKSNAESLIPQDQSVWDMWEQDFMKFSVRRAKC